MAKEYYTGIAGELASRGRHGDTMLMHVNPLEVEGLGALGPLTTNPDTGLPEAFVWTVPMILAAVGAVGGATYGGVTAKKRGVPLWQGILGGAAMGGLGGYSLGGLGALAAGGAPAAAAGGGGGAALTGSSGTALAAQGTGAANVAAANTASAANLGASSGLLGGGALPGSGVVAAGSQPLLPGMASSMTPLGTAGGSQLPVGGILGPAGGAPPIPAPGPVPFSPGAPIGADPGVANVASGGIGDQAAVNVASGGPQQNSMLAQYDALGSGVQPQRFASLDPSVTNYGTDASIVSGDPVSAPFRADPSQVGGGDSMGRAVEMQNILEPGLTEAEMGRLSADPLEGIKGSDYWQAQVDNIGGPEFNNLGGSEGPTKSWWELGFEDPAKAAMKSVGDNKLAYALGTAWIVEQALGTDMGEEDGGSAYPDDPSWEVANVGGGEGIGLAVEGDDRPAGSTRERRYNFGRV